MSALRVVDSLQFVSCANLSDISLPALSKFNDLSLDTLPALQTVAMDKLSSGVNFFVSGTPLQGQWRFPALRRLDAMFLYSNLPAAPFTLQLPTLAKINTLVVDTVSLVEIDAPNLQEIRANLAIPRLDDEVSDFDAFPKLCNLASNTSLAAIDAQLSASFKQRVAHAMTNMSKKECYFYY